MRIHVKSYQSSIFLSLLILSVLLKIVLLFTSQSMADSDEAIEGIMAMRILDQGDHLIYPYGIRYGAGVFVETHLAALLFLIFGISDIALKAAGLIIWSCCLLLVFLTGRRMGGTSVGYGAALLFSFSPAATQWSMKVAGGHQVAIFLCLLIIFLIERRVSSKYVSVLLPFAVFAHPIVIPFVFVMAVYLIFHAEKSTRLATMVWLMSASCLAALFLWPRGPDVWNPVNRSFDLIGLVTAIPRMITTLFTPNLSAISMPSFLVLLPAIIWLSLFIFSVVKNYKQMPLLIYLLAPLGVILAVDAHLLAARHLLLLYPISALAMAHALWTINRFRWALIIILLSTGGFIQIREISSPVFYGAGIQHRGVVRNDIQKLIAELDASNIRHVCCMDPMVQWNIIFSSRERIVARSQNPLDRVPEYALTVDQARLRGLPVALVGEVSQTDKMAPQKYRCILKPDRKLMNQLFPFSPHLKKETR